MYLRYKSITEKSWLVLLQQEYYEFSLTALQTIIISLSLLKQDVKPISYP